MIETCCMSCLCIYLIVNVHVIFIINDNNNNNNLLPLLLPLFILY